MSVAVANAKEQHVLRRDFKSGRWVDIAGEGKTCRVQVVKSSGGEYLLKIFPQGGQKLELKLSKENRIHFVDGFIQLPIAQSKELYGIKFSKTVEGDEFYTKMVKAVGVPQSYPRTTIGSDGNPDPVDSEQPKKKAVAQSLPQAPKAAAQDEARAKMPGQRSNETPPPVVKPAANTPSVRPNVAVGPSTSPKLQRSQREPANQPSPKQPPPGPVQHPPASHQPLAQPGAYQAQRSSSREEEIRQKSRHKYGQDQPDFGDNARVPPQPQPQEYDQRLERRLEYSPHNQPPRRPLSDRPLPQATPPDVHRPVVEPLIGANLPAVMPDVYRAEREMPHPIQPGHSAMIQPSHPTRAQHPANPALLPQIQYDRSGHPGAVHNGHPNRQQQNASPRRPAKLEPKDMKVAAESMVDAMNRHDEELALRMFHSMMEFMKESTTPVKCEMNFPDFSKKSDLPRPHTFTLNIQVEFQKPNKAAIPIFLYDVSPDNSISVLSSRVEHTFYIPRQCQNWIIGPRLVKGTELNKPIKEFGVMGDGVTEVNVFMYVMHTKKAQGPNEAVRMRHQQFNQQQQERMQLLQQQQQAQSAESRAAAPSFLRPAHYDSTPHYQTTVDAVQRPT